MKPLAKFMARSGFKVAGADLKGDETGELARENVKVHSTHDGRRLKNFDALVVSSSIKNDNSEIRYALKHGIPIIKRSELLGYVFTLFNKSVSIAGTHGKTTTTAMLATILKRFLSVTAFVGGETVEFSDYYSDGKFYTCIAETCEYNRNFLDISPTIATVLNVAYDHVDTYRNLDEVITAFKTFTKNSITIKNADDENSECIPSYLTFGVKNPADFTAKNVKSNVNGLRFTLCHNGKNSKVFVGVLGKHYAYCALAAIATAYVLGVPVDCSIAALGTYRGIKRRAEKIGFLGKTAIYSDYAHHPDEITATSKAFLTAVKGKTLVVFQPHTYSRTATLKKDFIKALKPIKHLAVFRTYSSREDVKYEGSAKDLFLSLENKNALYFESVDDLIKIFNRYDDVLFLGAGDLDGALRRVIKTRQTTVST